jgi:endonuclease/exonuclease/phosphatase family metal-dependent hydrolase
MRLISWNIQWARGADGKVDPARIVNDARALGDFDVLCLQEVAANFPGLAGASEENQFERFAQLLPDYTAIPVTAVDVLDAQGQRSLFGNLILSRYPVLRVLRYQLPWPPDPAVPSMPRTVLEATLDTPLGPIRVMTTHLEYYSGLQRAAQVEALRELHAQSCARAHHPPDGKRKRPGSPFAPGKQTTRAILTGDFNYRPDDPLHARLQAPIDVDTPRLVDVWPHLHPDGERPHSVGLYDHVQWPTPFTCDFIYASEDLLPHVREMQVDTRTPASDHQPLMIVLA